MKRTISEAIRTRWMAGALFALLVVASAPAARGFSAGPDRWTLNRTVVMQLSLGGTQNLLDGSTSFNQVARDALNIWNQHLVHLRFSSVFNSPVPPASSDFENSLFFSNTIFGKAFGNNTLAVTFTSFRENEFGVRVFSDSDLVFNTAYRWNSYRGALRPGIEDFRRVAIHELGHTLGLHHPDEVSQNVVAIMNSSVSNIELPQTDDINGVRSLYDNGPPFLSSVNAPVLLNISTRARVGLNENVLIGGFIIQGSQPATVILRAIGFSLRAVGIASPLLDPQITVFNANNQQVAADDDWFTGTNAETIGSYRLDPPNSRESALFLRLNPGAYTAVVEAFPNPAEEPTGVALFELYDLHTTGGRASNVSSRGQVQTGDNVMIGGFIIGGGVSKEVVVRAIGPSLARAGISNPLSDPTLSLRDANGNVVQANNDWGQGPNAGAIAARGLGPADTRESALLATLGPAAYTAIVSGVNGATGVALVEVYDQSPAP